MKKDVDEVVIASISVPTTVERDKVSVEDLGWGCMPNQLIDDFEAVIATKGWTFQMQDFINKTEFNAINCTNSIMENWQKYKDY